MHKGGVDKATWLLLVLPLCAVFVHSNIVCLDKAGKEDTIGCTDNKSFLNIDDIFFKNKHCPTCKVAANTSYYSHVQAKCAGHVDCVLLPHNGTWPSCNCSSISNKTQQICMDSKCQSNLTVLDLCATYITTKQGYIYQAWTEMKDTNKEKCVCRLKPTGAFNVSLVKLFFYAPNVKASDCLNISDGDQHYSFCGKTQKEETSKVILNGSTSHVQVVFNYRSPLRGVFWLKFESDNGGDDSVRVECYSSPQLTTLPSSTITTDEDYSFSTKHLTEDTAKPISSQSPTGTLLTNGYLSPTAATTRHNGNRSLSAGGAAGIAVVFIILIAVLVGLAIFCIRRRKLKKSTENSKKAVQQTNGDYVSSPAGIVMESPGVTQGSGDLNNTDSDIAALYAKPNKQKKNKQSNNTSASATTSLMSNTAFSPDEGKSGHENDTMDQANDYDYVTTKQVQHNERVGAPEDQTYYNVKTDHEIKVNEDSHYDSPRRHQQPNYENVPAKQGLNMSMHRIESNENKNTLEDTLEDTDDEDTKITENPLYT